MVDDLTGGRLATQHLLELGHRRIGFIRYTAFTAISALRLDGYRRAWKKPASPSTRRYSSSVMTVVRQAARPRNNSWPCPTRPARHFTHNDVLALGAMHAVQRRGLACPGNISIVGYDDTASSACFDPPLTTVRLPTDEIGREAASLILDLACLAREALPPQRTTPLPVQLIVRGSPARPAPAGGERLR